MRKQVVFVFVPIIAVAVLSAFIPTAGASMPDPSADSHGTAIYATPTNRSFWTSLFRLGFAGKPGTSPGQTAQPGPVSGGSQSPVVRVASTADHGPGSIRDALERPGGLWVYVDQPLSIRLKSPIRIASGNKTLIATSPTGERLLTLLDYGIRVEATMNVALSGVHVVDASGDGFEISRSRVIHLHNCWAHGFTDGGIDIVRGSTDVTVSETLISTGKKAVLIGASDTPVSEDVPGLGRMDDRFTRVTFVNVAIEGASVRCPMVRHAEMVEIFGATINCLAEGAIVESNSGARVRLVSGRVIRNRQNTILASDRVPGRYPGNIWVAPGFDTAGLGVVSNWPDGALYPMEPFRPKW